MCLKSSLCLIRQEFNCPFMVFVVLASCLNVRADDWPQFLGVNRDGISAESDLLDKIPASGLHVLWRVPGGVGMSAVAVVRNHAVTMWNTQDRLVITSLRADSGAVNWQTPLAGPYENAMGDGPRATPTILGDRVFAYTGSGTLACLKLSDGKLIWNVDVPAKMGVRPSEYGMSSSPLVVGDKVIVTCGGEGSAVVCLSTVDGGMLWKTGNGAAGYASPALLSVAGEDHVVAFTGAGVSGIDPSDGTILWHYPFKTPYDCNTASPISVGGRVFISAGENHGCALLEIVKQQDQYRVNEVWQSTMTKSVMRNEWQTAILLAGHLYGFDNVGSAGPVTHLACIQANTGKPVWQQPRFGKGNMVAADGKLWITTMKGEIVLVQATPEEFKELGRAKLMGKTRQTLSIQNGRGFLRDDKEVICVSLTD